MNPKLVHTAPIELLPLTEHVVLHPGKGHHGINSIVQDLGKRRGLIPDYKPMPKVLQAAYAENGYAWEDAIEEQHRRRMSLRSPVVGSKFAKLVRKAVPNLQVKMCVSGIHMIPDNIWSDEPIPVPKVGAVVGAASIMAVMRDSNTKAIDEFKWTCSQPPADVKDFFKKKWAWLVVSHCYAFWADVNCVRFVVCWVGYKPEPVEYVFEYNDADKEEAWDMVVTHLARMQKKGAK